MLVIGQLSYEIKPPPTELLCNYQTPGRHKAPLPLTPAITFNKRRAAGPAASHSAPKADQTRPGGVYLCFTNGRTQLE